MCTIDDLALKHNILSNQVQGYIVFDFSSLNIKNEIISINKTTRIIGGDWEDIVFEINETPVQFQDGKNYKNCTFKGIKHETKPSLDIINPSLNSCTIGNDWHNISFHNHVKCKIEYLTISGNIDLINCERITFNNSTFIGTISEIRGTGSLIKNSTFRPKLIRANFERARFDNSHVLIEDWIDRCDGKSSVDLISAKNITDDWAEIRDAYTGLRMYVIIFLTTGYFLPYFLKIITYSVVTKISDIEVFNSLPHAPLIQVLLFPYGKGQYSTLFAWIGIFLILYNVIRVFMTLQISKMREREEHYRLLGLEITRPRLTKKILFFHGLLKISIIIVITFVILRYCQILMQPVPVFKRIGDTALFH